MLAEVLKEEYNVPVYGAFTVQEEIDTAGRRVAAYAVDPDLAIVLEGRRAAIHLVRKNMATAQIWAVARPSRSWTRR